MNKESRKAWQDDKPWVVVDSIVETERDDKERTDNNQKSFNVSLNKLFAWIKSFFAVIALSSCSSFQYTATSPSGTETVAYVSLGGSSAMETAGGTRLTQNHNKSFGQGMQAATAIAAGISAAYTKNSDNSLTATQNTNAAALAAKQSANATAQSINATNTAAKAATTEAAINAGAVIEPLKITPP